MRYDPDHKEKTHRKLLREAAKAIRAEGPLKVSVAEVMKKAGLTHGGFYAHFASKDDLIAETIDFMFKEAVKGIETMLDGKAAAEGLSTYVDFYLSDLHRSTAIAGCPIAALSADLPRLSAGARARFAAGVSMLTAQLTSKLSDAGHPRPQEAATSLLAELSGAAALARAVADESELSDAVLSRSKAAIKSRLELEGRT